MSKTKKYQNITKLVLHIFEDKHVDFLFRYSCWPRLTESFPELINKFTYFNKDLRWDNNFQQRQIANMNESPFFMNISNTKMIAKIDSKEVNIETHGQERIHVIVILWIVFDGTNYPNVSA